MGQHEKKCERETAAKVRDRELLRALREGSVRVNADAVREAARERLDPYFGLHDDAPAAFDMPDSANVAPAAHDQAIGAAEAVNANGDNPNVAAAQSGFKLDDIRVEFHPSSHRDTTVHHFEEYGKRNANLVPPTDDAPWRPFPSRLDFEFAELAHKAALSRAEIDGFLRIMQRCSAGKEKLTLSSAADVNETWKAASQHLTPVCS